jgi:activator of HSP90 ATPase
VSEHDDLPEIVVGRLLLRDQLRNWHWQAWATLRRLVVGDKRFFMSVDGWVVAKFVREEDAQLFMDWLGKGHVNTLAAGMKAGREHQIADFQERVRTLGASQAPAD